MKKMEMKPGKKILICLSIPLILLFFVNCDTIDKPENYGTVIGDDLFQLVFSVSKNDVFLIVSDITDGNDRFSKSEYESLLEILSDDRYIVVPMKDFSSTNYDDKIVVGMRHDVDFDPFCALKMSELEAEYGFATTYYFLHTAKYFGRRNVNHLEVYYSMLDIYKAIFDLGHEVGDHNNYISIYGYYDIDIKNMLSWWHGIAEVNGIEINGTSAHGASPDYFNGWVFSDIHERDSIIVNGRYVPIGYLSLEECGYDYEAYFVGYSRDNYYSEAGGAWREETGDPIDHLHEIPLGEKVVILTHPCWWSL